MCGRIYVVMLTYVCICKHAGACVQLPCSTRSFKSRSSGEDSKPASFSALASARWDFAKYPSRLIRISE